MSGQDNSRERAAFEKFIATKRILIADPSAASRSGLFTVFKELGAQPSDVVLVNSFAQAHQQIAEVKPQIVVAEFEFGKRCGLDLLQRQREQRPAETKDSIFVVVTGNTSQTAVARAAEEDIDAYILKPYTSDTVRRTLIKACVEKINPSVYYMHIDTGKVHMAEGRLEEAEKEFVRASELDPAPALAHYYIGQVKVMRAVMEQARGSYETGLNFNRIHYKCMVGLYELFMSQHKHVEAYDVVKRISQYFPANPKRLAEVLRLAVVNGKYEDIEKYYSTFVNIDERDENLIKYVCAALIVCGKYYLSTNLGHQRAIELFTKAAATGSGRLKVLREIILSLLEYNLQKEAKTFLTKFPPDSFSSDEFLLMRFLVMNTEGPPSLIIENGRTLLAKGIVDEHLYAVMIRRSLEARLPEVADDYLQQAIKNFPDKREHFERLVKRYDKAA